MGQKMLFGKRKQVVKRILIVEDEPFTAFSNENILKDASYRIVATINRLDEALDLIGREAIDLVLSDIRLQGRELGISLARAAKKHEIPTLFVTGHPHPVASEIAVGCLAKPYSERQLIKAIRCVDAHLQGVKVKPPRGLELFVAASEQS